MSAWPGLTGSEYSRKNKKETFVSGSRGRHLTNEHDPPACLPVLASYRAPGCAAELIRAESSRPASCRRGTEARFGIP